MATITTIIATHKRPGLLKRAINSVLRQNFDNVEVIVCDDCSNDETAAVVKNISQGDPRIRYHCNHTNLGGTKTFNVGLSKITTPFFSLLSDDNVLLPHFYERALRGFERCPEAAFSATEVVYVDAKGRYRGVSNDQWEAREYRPPEGLLAMQINRHPPTWDGIVFRQSVIAQVGFLDEGVGGAIDYDFIQRIAAHCPFVISAELGAVFVVHEDSWGATSRLNFVWPGYQKMLTNVSLDAELSFDTKRIFSHLANKATRKKVFYYGRQSIKQKDGFGAEQAAAILYSDLNAPSLAHILRIANLLCCKLPFGIQGLVLLNRIRRLVPRDVTIPSVVANADIPLYLMMLGH